MQRTSKPLRALFSRRFCTAAANEGKEVVPRKSFSPVSPQTGQPLPAIFEEATVDDVKQAAHRAAMAFPIYRSESLETRARFLEAIADEIEAIGMGLVHTCMEETGLPLQRLTGERGRTTGQLRMFAEVIRDGLFLDAVIDTPDPTRVPLPKPDLRRVNIPVGPVAVFGASNFPLAFSVAGGDTASALAAGNTVVVKGHPAHPYTSQMVSDAILRAAEKCDMPPGTFNFIQGVDHEVGTRLVADPHIQAVGFTGSFRAGRVLNDVANGRPQPIPVYAEMGSTNPFFVLPGTTGKMDTLHDLAKGLVTSLTLGVGQFCTQPGLIFMLKDNGLKDLLNIMAEDISMRVPESMLTKSISDNYKARVEETIMDPRFELVAMGELPGETGVSENAVHAAIFTTSAKEFLKDHNMEEEIFGPCSIIVKCDDMNQMLRCAEQIGGHLTVSVHGTPEDYMESVEMLDVLQDKAGRLVFNGYPTGVEVSNAMVHGGPFPASSNVKTTSVGKKAIDRFVRPLCYQNAPQNVLPEALQDENPLEIVRNVDGILTTENMTEFMINYG